MDMGKNIADPIPRAYVIGAGFSKSLGLPLIQDLLPKIISFCDEVLENAINGELPLLLEDLTRELLPLWTATNHYSPDVVELFSLLQTAEMMSAFCDLRVVPPIQKTDLTALASLKMTLSQLFHKALFEVTNSGPEETGKFFHAVPEGTVFVSLNWDNLLERGLHRARKTILLDTYRPNAISVFKLHGSIDWFEHDVRRDGKRWLPEYRPLSFPILPEYDPREGEYIRERFPIARMTSVEAPGLAYEKIMAKCYVPLMFTMGHKASQILDNPRLHNVWRTARECLRRAEEIVIIGYSMPSDDLEVRLLLRDAVRFHEVEYKKSTKVRILNPDRNVFSRFMQSITKDIEQDFRCFSPDMDNPP